MDTLALAGSFLALAAIVILLALIAIIVSGIHTILREISIDTEGIRRALPPAKIEQIRDTLDRIETATKHPRRPAL